MSLTPKQKLVLEFIKSFSSDKDYAPSLQEIANYLERSLSTAQHYVEELKQKGYLQKQENIARGLIATDNISRQIFKLGYISAGNPIEPIENPEPISVPDYLIKSPGNYYALEVKGTSMIEDNILEGDVIVVKYQNIAKDGDRVIAVTEQGATLKVFRSKSGKTFLEPRNEKFKPIYPKELEIRGVFCGLIRREK